jgi:hypothetical protein
VKDEDDAAIPGNTGFCKDGRFHHRATEITEKGGNPGKTNEKSLPITNHESRLLLWNLPFDKAQGPEPVEGESEIWN